MLVSLYLSQGNLEALEIESKLTGESISVVLNYILSEYFEGVDDGDY